MRARVHFSVLASASQPHGAQRISENFSTGPSQCKDLLPENALSQGFCRNFTGAILFKPCTKQSKISGRIVH
jgi:hypothetical protein